MTIIKKNILYRYYIFVYLCKKYSLNNLNMYHKFFLAFFLSAIVSMNIVAQDDAYSRLKSMAGHIVGFNKNCPQEKVFLHFDNKAYYLGETIWFSAYVVDAGTLLPIAKSKVLYVELLSPEGDIIAYKKLKLVAGRCYGNLTLIGRRETFDEGFSNKINIINALRSGYYEVRAYTREMQNFGEGGYFSRVFPVYDAPETEGNYAQMQFTTSSTQRVSETRKTSKKGDELNISFYPEGGALIEGIESRVAFKATDAYGLPIKLNDPIVLNGNNINVMHEGMGAFTYTPSKETDNNVEALYNGKKYTFKLPKAEKEGYKMYVDNMQKDSIRINVERKTTKNETIGITLLCRGILLHFDTIRWNNNSAQINISKEKLLSGVQQVTLYTESGKILAERMIFVQNDKMPTGIKIDLNFDKESYKPYEKVALSAKATDADGNPITTYMSLAVRDGDVENGGNYENTIATDLLLSSDLKGYIANPEYYFESDDEEHTKALDLLMMVQGWRRYDWKTMAGITPFKITNYLEEGITIDGEVLSLTFKKPQKDIKVTMRATSLDGTLVQEHSVVTNEKGEFNFRLEDFYGDWKLMLFLAKDNERLEKDARIKINRAPMGHLRVFEQWETTTPKPIVHYSTSQAPIQDAIQVEDYLLLPGVTIKEQESYLDCEAFYVINDCEDIYDRGELVGNINEYLLKRMPRFIEEDGISNVLSYKNTPITFVPMRREGSVWGETIPVLYAGLFDLEEIEYILFFPSPFAHQHLKLSNRHKEMYSNSPLIDVTSRAVDTKRYLALIYPRTKAATPYEMKGQRATYVEGYSEVRDFFSPDYKNSELPVDPDYRRTLYWNPLLRTDADGTAKVEFYNNSRCHIMETDAATITPKGKIGSGKARIAPKKK